MAEIKKIFCNTCKYETNHEVKSTHERSYREIIEDRGREYVGYYEDYEYRFLICRGCDTATLEEKWSCAGMNDYDGNELYTYEYSPKRRNLGLREAKCFLHINK